MLCGTWIMVFLHCSKSKKVDCSMVLYHTPVQEAVSRGAVRSAASSYAAMRTVAGSRPVLVIV